MEISIITPSYNQGKFIERTLQSVATQLIDLPSHVNLIHAVFDGGSTDNTIDVLRSFQPAGHLRWVTEKDDGQADAVNKGLRASQADIIGWLNSDDIYYPGAVAKVIDFFKKNPEVDVVYGMAYHIDCADNIIETYPSESWNFKRLQDICYICQPALFFRQSVVEQCGVLDDKLNYCMDYEYWLRLGQKGVRFAYLEETLAGSRFYQETKTLGARVKVHQEINTMFKQKFGKVPDKWLFNYAHAAVESKVGRDKHPVLFIMALIIVVSYAAWRWNKKLSPVIRRQLVQWSKLI